MAFCDIHSIKELVINSHSQKEAIGQSIEIGKNQYNQSLKVVLPALIRKPSDVWGSEKLRTVPNFITQKSITAPPVILKNNQQALKENLNHCIVCIPNADPDLTGYFHIKFQV